jgi:hypothetical protein
MKYTEEDNGKIVKRGSKTYQINAFGKLVQIPKNPRKSFVPEW